MVETLTKKHQLTDYLIGRLGVYCYMVKKGKPAAMLPIKTKYLESVKELIRERQLEFHVENLTKDWYKLWIYKHSHILEVIKALQQEPETTFDHWVLGKLFGYSEESIGDYISKKV